MKPGYLFISNETKGTIENEMSLAPYHTGSFDAASIYAANHLGFKIYRGINRIKADKIVGVDYEMHFYNQHIYRSVFDFYNNLIAYRNLKKFLHTHTDIKLLHCNTPIGGVIGRICGHKAGLKVIYMAHGFHFFKGAPIFNRTVFKWIEQILARLSDAIITINKEDFIAAQKFHLKPHGRVYYVPGVGVNTKLYDNVNVDKDAKLHKLGLPVNTKVGLVVGDLNNNKNVETLIKSLPATSGNFHIVICGVGPNEKSLKKLADNLNVSNRVHFLGYRNDMKELYAISDMFLFASKREGLPRSTMEAMCVGLPCVVSRIRGNIDLIQNELGGYLVNPMDYVGFAKAINYLIENPIIAKQMGEYNKLQIKKFDIEIVKQRIVEIYEDVLSR